MPVSEVALRGEGEDSHGPSVAQSSFSPLPAGEHELFCPVPSVTALTCPKLWRPVLGTGQAQQHAASGLGDSDVWAKPVARPTACSSPGHCL